MLSLEATCYNKALQWQSVLVQKRVHQEQELACAGKGVLWPGLAHACGSMSRPPDLVALKGPSSFLPELLNRNTCRLQTSATWNNDMQICCKGMSQ